MAKIDEWPHLLVHMPRGARCLDRGARYLRQGSRGAQCVWGCMGVWVIRGCDSTTIIVVIIISSSSSLSSSPIERGDDNIPRWRWWRRQHHSRHHHLYHRLHLPHHISLIQNIQYIPESTVYVVVYNVLWDWVYYWTVITIHSLFDRTRPTLLTELRDRL